MARVVEVIGDKKLVRELQHHGREGVKRVSRGLKKAGLYLQRESQLIVPVDLGPLKKSADTRYEEAPGHHDVRNSRTNGIKLAVAVSYETEYALFVHEDLYAQHQPGKVAKFLEKPAVEKKDEIARVFLSEVKNG